jgi:HSP20 family protein
LQYTAPVVNKWERLFSSDLENNPPVVPLVELDDAAFLFPKVDIVETKDHFVLKAELPGFDKKDLDVVFDKGILTIQAERKPESGQKFHYRERPMGTFTRKFQLSRNIHKEGIRAIYRNGILSVYLPKVAKPEEKEIKIR